MTPCFVSHRLLSWLFALTILLAGCGGGSPTTAPTTESGQGEPTIVSQVGATPTAAEGLARAQPTAYAEGTASPPVAETAPAAPTSTAPTDAVETAEGVPSPTQTAPEPTVGTTPTAAQPAPTPTAGVPQKPDDGFPLTYMDASGRKVVIPKYPQRIISLFATNNDTLFTIGAGPQIVAVDDFTQWPKGPVAKPSVGGNNFKFDVERMVALKPDLVITSFGTEEIVDKPLRDAGVKVVTMPFPTSIEQTYQLMRDLGRITYHEAAAEVEVIRLEETVNAVQSVSEDVQTQTVYFETDASVPGKPYTISPGSLIEEMITLAGGRNVFSDVKFGSAGPQVGYEAIVRANPQVIILANVKGSVGRYFVNPVTLAEVRQRPGFATIGAVRNRRLIAIDPALTNPGPRLRDGLRAISAAIHPLQGQR